ncbi:MAG: hypothetical protein ABSH25_08445 [Syntrophorhabdales bacterium]|jgi:hypothetical protein
MKATYRYRKYHIIVRDIETYLYDMSYTRIAEFFLDEVADERIKPGSSDAWYRCTVAEAYETGQLKIPVRYRRRVRKAILQVKLDESAVAYK